MCVCGSVAVVVGAGGGSERAKEGVCSLIVARENVDKEGRESAKVSMGADRKANTWELVRALSGLLQRLQRRVALESLGESGSSFRAESVFRETVSMGAGAGAEGCQWALTRKQTLYGRAAHLTVLTLWFLDKSNASSFASAASRLPDEKLMSVCSGWMPQRVMICGISEATDRMASAPSPSELLSTLR